MEELLRAAFEEFEQLHPSQSVNAAEPPPSASLEHSGVRGWAPGGGALRNARAELRAWLCLAEVATQECLHNNRYVNSTSSSTSPGMVLPPRAESADRGPRHAVAIEPPDMSRARTDADEVAARASTAGRKTFRPSRQPILKRARVTRWLRST